MGIQPRVSAVAAAGVVGLIGHCGGDAERIFGAARLPLLDAADPEKLLDLNRYCDLFEQAARVLVGLLAQVREKRMRRRPLQILRVVDLVGVDSDQADTARIAYRMYGKGRHRAALNYGDCFSYALAKVSGQPLLFKGDDFARTDIGLVLLS